ncbi:MAG: hypothetical protein RI897_4293 [Verrucomicrobiota bacterium]|jgi:uncharacterized SAM-binding protein YcdF (DUF218 family)
MDPVALIWGWVVVMGLWLWRKDSKRGAMVLWVGAGLLWVMEVTRLPARLMVALERPYVRSAQGLEGRVDAVIVLGGFGSGTSREITGMDWSGAADRILTGMELVREGKGKVLVVSWGGEEEAERERCEAWVKRWKVGEVVSLQRSANTREEAVHSAALVEEKKWKRVALVTSAWHMGRAESVFAKVGLEVIPVGCDFQGHTALGRDRCYVPQSESLVLLRYWLHEVVGSGYYRVRGHL